MSNRSIILFGVCVALLLLCTSCFTGVEGTRRVEMSKNDVTASLPTNEDHFVSLLTGMPLEQWTEGMEFVALDDRAPLIFESRTLPVNPLELNMRGKVIRYVGRESRINAGLDTIALLHFADSAHHYYYEMRQPVTTSLDLPMFTDKRLVERFDSLLRGRRLWVTYPFWHTTDTATMQGLKFAPVTVEHVVPGYGPYPVRILFNDGTTQAWLPVSLPQSGPTSRRFSNQFSLTDPRVKYSGISDETWSLIQQQLVAIGMTKNEVRLALGSPKDISQGHNSALVYELWQYSDGSYLIFADGLVQSFKLARRR